MAPDHDEATPATGFVWLWMLLAFIWFAATSSLAAESIVTGAVAQAPPCPPQGVSTGDKEPITPIPPPPAADPFKLALGERLFSDTRLSGNGKLACVSCHDIHANGSRSNYGAATGPFDTLTVFNAVLNYRLNWTGNFRAPAAEARIMIRGCTAIVDRSPIWLFSPAWPVDVEKSVKEPIRFEAVGNVFKSADSLIQFNHVPLPAKGGAVVLVDIAPRVEDEGADCAAIAEELAGLEKSCAVAAARAVRRAASCGAHRDRGYADQHDWYAAVSGTTSGLACESLFRAAKAQRPRSLVGLSGDMYRPCRSSQLWETFRLERI